ncbi:low molecular weight protein arginine phosphatase [Sporomusa acidovorans]|uniref:Protein-arginine-phosphatase n=1 Tax=Sporomusa acidovorans (strain ATCC 49682 / DSM 3132 / Mol) TaxID=1123286 RepID=A0ABZ3J790_SPOA4|nr:low molecular weight protein arginine phosphatase [Sporomusa acidovorans]OZC21199.1 Low molecular weight protein-tyrosine-phosphatase YwlE [Sporomusa acidovorans DSM 3132]SDE64525.1 protein-tyrosine phosphatase [Sporomusa acidovorans]
MFEILIVCTGNTCRSPMAAALLANMIEQAGLAGEIMVASAGISAWQQPASLHAQAVMRQAGCSLDKHCSQQLDLVKLQAADLVLTMTAAHKQTLVDLAPGMAGKIYTLAEFAGELQDVADPFGGNEARYRECAGQLERLLSKSWGKIVSLAGKK